MHIAIINFSINITFSTSCPWNVNLTTNLESFTNFNPGKALRCNKYAIKVVIIITRLMDAKIQIIHGLSGLIEARETRLTEGRGEDRVQCGEGGQDSPHRAHDNDFDERDLHPQRNHSGEGGRESWSLDAKVWNVNFLLIDFRFLEKARNIHSWPLKLRCMQLDIFTTQNNFTFEK